MTHIAPLAGIRIVEIGHGVATALAGRLMAGLGADVTLVEPPSGNALRRQGPFPPGDESPETSAAFLYFHAGKSSVVVDRHERDRTESLLRRADILVVGSPLGERAEAGLAKNELLADYPQLVVVSVSPYGESGPHAHYVASDLTALASGGQMSLMGEPDRHPLKSYGNQAESQAAFQVFGAALAGYLHRTRTGTGTYVEISVQEIQAASMEAQGPMAFNGDPLPGMFAGRTGNSMRAIWSQYPCRDGYVGIFVNAPNIPSFFAAIGRSDLLDRAAADPEYLNSAELAEVVAAWCAERTREEVYLAAIEHGAPFSYVATPEDLLTSEVIARTGLWQEVEDPTVGTLRIPGPPMQLDGRLPATRAPRLGEHDELLTAGQPT